MPLIRIAVLILTSAAIGTAAFAQGGPSHHHDRSVDIPREPGQGAFAAIQEIVAKLLATPGTDWSKVNIEGLRQHLIDMDEVTLRAEVRAEPIDLGLRMQVTGSNRTREAIQRMVPAHAHEIDGMHGWTVRAAPLSSGMELTVTSQNAADVPKIRALGFIGIMVLGSHHQPHHLAMALGAGGHAH